MNSELRSEIMKALIGFPPETVTEAEQIVDRVIALIQKEQGWRDGPPPTEPDNKAWMVHRDGWKHGKIAKYSAGAWWIDGNRYSPHLPFDRHCEPPTPPQGEDAQ